MTPRPHPFVGRSGGGAGSRGEAVNGRGDAAKRLAKGALDRAAALGFLLLGAAEAARRGFRPPALEHATVRRVLVVRLDLLGDFVLSIPAIASLRAAYPDAALDLLVLPYVAPLARQVAGVDRVIELDVNQYRRPSGWRRWSELTRVLRALRARRYDLAVVLHGRVPSGLAALSGARYRVGYAGESYPGALHRAIPGRRYHRPAHEVAYCLELVRALGLPTVEAAPELPVAPEAAARVDALLAAAGVGPADCVVAVHPGASNGVAKRWPAERWAALCGRLASGLGARVVLTGSAADGALTARIAAAADPPPLDLAGQTPLPELAALLKRAALVLSGDTGPLHLAQAVGTPVVAIFGPTDPTNTGPCGPSAVVLRRSVPCGPCYDLRSPADCKLPDRSAVCMQLVTVEEVFQAAAALRPAVPAARPVAPQ